MENNSNIKSYNLLSDSELVAGMQKENIICLESFTEYTPEKIDCVICGKNIRALPDMNINGEFYCTKCRMDIIREKSKIDILISRKNELLLELDDINLKINQLSLYTEPEKGEGVKHKGSKT